MDVVGGRMDVGNYAIKDGSTTIAYLQVTQAGSTVMPKGIRASALATLQKSLDKGVLPEGLVATAIEVATGFVRPRPDWRQMTPSATKRLRWLKARGRA